MKIHFSVFLGGVKIDPESNPAGGGIIPDCIYSIALKKLELESICAL